MSQKCLRERGKAFARKFKIKFSTGPSDTATIRGRSMSTVFPSLERQTISGLLRGTEADLGWSTENRVQQLLKAWGWAEH